MSWILTGISGDGTGNITGGISFFSASLLPNRDYILKFLDSSLASNLFAEASSLFLLSSSHGFNCETYCIIKLPFCTFLSDYLGKLFCQPIRRNWTPRNAI